MELKIKKLSDEERVAIARVREEIIERLRNTPEVGVEVEYLGKNYFVKKGVFWPRPDSIPLVENFEINNGDKVLDVCTGSGVIAVAAALKGASIVVALDINPDAIETVRINAKRHGVEAVIEARVSDVFLSLEKTEKFDVITCNPPFTDEPATDFASRTLRDSGLKVIKHFFDEVDGYLSPNGRIYLSQANSGNIYDMLELAERAGFGVKMIGRKEIGENSLEFYAFELTRKYDRADNTSI